MILERVSNGEGGGGGVGGQCVLLKPKIFIPIPTWEVFIGIITPMKQKFVAANRTKWTIRGSFSRYLSGRHYLLYSAPRKRLPGFLQTLHSVKEMNFVKAISQWSEEYVTKLWGAGWVGALKRGMQWFCYLCVLHPLLLRGRKKIWNPLAQWARQVNFRFHLSPLIFYLPKENKRQHHL